MFCKIDHLKIFYEYINLVYLKKKKHKNDNIKNGINSMIYSRNINVSRSFFDYSIMLKAHDCEHFVSKTFIYNFI